MDILGKLLGSQARVKIMRLFLLNKDQTFTSKDISSRTRVNSNMTRKEVALLKGVGFIKKLAKGWVFNPLFKYVREFEGILVKSDSFDDQDITNSFKKAGKVKLLIVSGVFIKNKDSRVDLLLVGDKMKKSKIEDAILRLQAEIGTELSYATFDSQEFLYRYNMYDKLVRDILDFPHRVLFESKELSTRALKKP